MDLAQKLGSVPLATRRALGLLLTLVLLAAALYGVVSLAQSATREGRCQEVLANEHRSDYLAFEFEGCRAQIEAPARVG